MKTATLNFLFFVPVQLYSHKMAEVRKKHVLFLTYPAFGHIIPMLEFARRISEHHYVTFAASKSKAEQLRERELFVDGAHDNLVLYGIDDEALGDFDDPDDPEAFAAIFTSILPALRKLLEEVPVSGQATSPSNSTGIARPVDVVVADNFVADPLMVCRDRSIPFYLFNSAPASLARFYLFVDENAPLIPDSEMDPFMSTPEPGGSVPMSELLLKFFLPVKKIFPYALGMAHNTLAAIDKEELALVNAAKELSHLQHFAVGPLIPEPSKKLSNANLRTQEKVKKWLRGKDTRSVIYVSHGTMAVPKPAEQITEIGKALLQLNQPFIWSLREVKHEFLPQEISEKIALQFEDPESKFLVLPWAPQKEILGDPAVAVFLTHGGWNSVQEGLSYGVPMIVWPMFADQRTNGELIRKFGIGVLLEGTGTKPKRMLMADEIAESLAKVGNFGKDASEGNGFLDAAQLWKEEIAQALSTEGSSGQDIVAFCEFSQIVPT